MPSLGDPQTWISLVTLTVLELVLGIDNLVFLAIQANRLPPEQRDRGRKIGLALALVMRLALLAFIFELSTLSRPLFEVQGHSVSLRDIVLLVGGLFLLYKGTQEIHGRLEGEDEAAEAGGRAGFAAVITQIVFLDIVFSIDSVITAVGVAEEIAVMMAAIVIAVIAMLVVSGPLSAFVNRHPTVKMLALSFLLMIGMVLVADGIGFHVPRGYIYAAMGFSVAVEALNLIAGRKRHRAE